MKNGYEERKAQLLGLIEKRDLRTVGEPVFARYNSPYMPWFLRRNEVLIPVTGLNDNCFVLGWRP